MARKNSGISRSEQGASKTMRRVGSVLTFVAVSVIVVAAGYFVGQAVIDRFFTDSLGPTPGTPVASVTTPAPQSTASSDSRQHNVASEPNSSASTIPNTVPSVEGTTEGTQQPASPPTTNTNTSAGAPPVTRPAESTNTTTGQQSAAPPSSGTGSGAKAISPPAAAAPEGQSGKQVWHRVQVGNFTSRSDAEAVLARLRAEYPDAYIVVSDVFRVQIGSFNSRAGADEAVTTLQAAGYADVHLISVEL